MNLKRILLKTLKFILQSLLFFLIFIASYLCVAYFISRLEIPAEKVQEYKELEIFILSNGVHTDIVVPVKNQVFDWRKFVKIEHTKKKDSIHRYLAFGWGDKGFYLDTPSWSELKTSTAVNAAFGLSTTAIHTTFHYEIQVNKSNCRRIKMTKNQYARLVKYILNSFQRDRTGNLQYIKTNAVYGEHDVFYEATGNYSMLQTCNSWANKGLIASGQKAALWTAFQGGIFCHYSEK